MLAFARPYTVLQWRHIDCQGSLMLLCSKAATALWKDVCQAYDDKDLKALTKSTTDLLQLLEDLDDLLASHE